MRELEETTRGGEAMSDVISLSVGDVEICAKVGL